MKWPLGTNPYKNIKIKVLIFQLFPYVSSHTRAKKITDKTKKKPLEVVFALERIFSDRLHPGYANFLN